MSDVRFYKGRYRVEVLQKSKRDYLVQLLEDVDFPFQVVQDGCTFTIHAHRTKSKLKKGFQFVTVPRLLWKKPRP